MEDMKARDMTKGNPMKLILFFSIPLLIGNIFQQLYSMVDTIIVGRFIDSDALAAVGTTGPLSFLIIGFIIGITGGFAVIVAQRFGAKDEKGLRKAVAMSIILCTIITIVVTALSVICTRPLLEMINTPDNIIEDSYNYIVVIFWGIGATMLYNMIACILRALGDSKTPLYFLIISSILNIVLDLVFIINLDMGVAGAAWATVISQGISGVLCFFYTKKTFPILRLKKEDFKFDKVLAMKHLSIGLPMAFQFSITAIGTIVLQGALNLFGSTKIAAFTAANKVEQLVMQPAQTFGVTMANYTGQNLGANRIDRIKKGVTQCTILTMIFCAIAIFVMNVFGEALCNMFLSESNAEIIDAAMMYLRICSYFFAFVSVIFLYRNVLQGMGRSFMPLMAGVFELVMRSLVAFTLPGVMGYMGICFAGPFAWIGASVPLAITYFMVIHKMMKEYKEKNPVRIKV